MVLGVLALRRVLRDGQRGVSLRNVVWYTALTVFNAALYVAAYLYQLQYGHPPELPANPATDWSLLTDGQRSTAIRTYQLEQLPYIAMAVALMSQHSTHATQHNTTRAYPASTLRPATALAAHCRCAVVSCWLVAVCAPLTCSVFYRELKSRTYRPSLLAGTKESTAASSTSNTAAAATLGGALTGSTR